MNIRCPKLGLKESTKTVFAVIELVGFQNQRLHIFATDKATRINDDQGKTLARSGSGQNFLEPSQAADFSNLVGTAITAVSGIPGHEQHPNTKEDLSFVWRLLRLVRDAIAAKKAHEQNGTHSSVALFRKRSWEAYQECTFSGIELVGLDEHIWTPLLDNERQSQLDDIERLEARVEDGIAKIVVRYREKLKEFEERYERQAREARYQIEKTTANIREDSESIEARIQAIFQGAESRLGEAQKTHETNLSNIRKEVKAELEKAQTLIDETAEKLDHLLGDADDKKTEAATQLEEMKEDISTKQEEIEAAYDKYQAYIRRLGQVTEEAGREKLVKFFKEARWNAAIAGFIFFALFIAAAGGVVWLLLESIGTSGTLPWQGVVLRITSASMAVYFAVYAARQTTRSRNIYTEYERLIAELSTIEAYLSTQDEEVIRMVKLLMLPEFFGKNAARIGPEALPDVDDSNPTQTLNVFGKTLPKLAQPGGGAKGNQFTSLANAVLPGLANALKTSSEQQKPTPGAQPKSQLQQDIGQLVQSQQTKALPTPQPVNQLPAPETTEQTSDEGSKKDGPSTP